MGKIKDNAEQLHELSDVEFTYLKAIQELRKQAADLYNTQGQLAAIFLKYICTTRLGYDEKAELGFEIDFDKDDRQLKVVTLPEKPAEA